MRTARRDFALPCIGLVATAVTIGAVMAAATAAPAVHAADYPSKPVTWVVPFPADTVADLVGGTLDIAFVDVATAMPYLKAGKIKPLAIIGAGMSAHPSSLIPASTRMTVDGAAIAHSAIRIQAS